MSDDALAGIPSAPLEATPAAAATATAAGTGVDHRGERARRLKWSILTSIIFRPLAFVTQIVTVPLFLNYLGTERYGMYESVGALAAWLTLTNAGLSLGLINRLTDCHVSGDRDLARRYVSSMVLVLLAMTTFFTLAISLAIPLIDWQRVFPADLPLTRAQVPGAVWASALITLWGILFLTPHPIYMAYQESYRNNLWDGAAKLLTLGACAFVVLTPWGLVGVVCAAAGVNMLVRLVNMVVLFAYEKPWLMPSPRYFDGKLLLGTLKQGFGLFLISCASLGVFQVDKLIIGHVLGPAEVAHYSVIARPFMLVFGLYSVILNPLWPAHGEALRRGDVAWSRRVLRLSVAGGCAAVLLCGVMMFFFGDWILRVWTRGEIVGVSRPLVVAMTALFILWTTVSSISVLLNSAGVLRAQIWFMGLHASLNVIVAYFMAKRFGITGVAWSMTITGLATSVWGYPWMLRTHIFRRTWAPEPPPAAAAPPPPTPPSPTPSP